MQLKCLPATAPCSRLGCAVPLQACRPPRPSQEQHSNWTPSQERLIDALLAQHARHGLLAHCAEQEVRGALTALL